MKKIIAIILAAVLVLSFAACKKTDKNPDTTAAADAQTSEQAGDVTGEETSSEAESEAASDEGRPPMRQTLSSPPKARPRPAAAL